MPFDSISQFEKSFPAIKNLTPDQKRVALEIFNSAMDRGDTEETAIAKAIGRAKKLSEGFKPPQSARNNAKKVLRWREEHGDEVKGMTRVGWTRANQLAKGETLSLKTVKRMAQFNRHRKNAKIDPKYKNTPWKDAGYVAWLGWGGTSGINWAKKVVQSSKNKSMAHKLKTYHSFAEVKVTDEELEEMEFEVLRSGEAHDPRYGVFKITEDRLERLKENFDGRVLGIDVALDLNHDPDHKALAWVKELQIRDVGGGEKALFAKFRDFTEEAKKFFKEKMFRYFSVEFDAFTRATDGKKETFNDVLKGIALTNRPVIKGMSPTFFSETIDNSIVNHAFDMSILMKLAEDILSRDKVSKADAAFLRASLSELPEEDQTEDLEEKVEEVEAKAESSEEEEAEADADAEGGDADGEEGDESSDEDEEGADEDEESEEGEEGAELSEPAKVALAERDKKIDMLLAEKKERAIEDSLKSMTLSEGEVEVGFTKTSLGEVKEFLMMLSDEQREKFTEILPKVRNTSFLLSEEGSSEGVSYEGGEKSYEDQVIELAEKKMRKAKEDGRELGVEEAQKLAQAELSDKK